MRIAPTPVSEQERITILDSLRGIAILGILLMNIPSFGLPGVVGHDPSVLNEHGVNYSTWYLINWIPEGTQRAIFSMLFGAGIILFTTRQEKKLSLQRAYDAGILTDMGSAMPSQFGGRQIRASMSPFEVDLRKRQRARGYHG